MLSMKDTNKLLKNVLRAMPAIPYFAKKKTSIAPFVLGAIGAAIVGGIAAVMAFSPRTRYRALDLAKDGYGKVRGQIDHLGITERLGRSDERNTTPQPYSNGLAEDAGYSRSGV
jgi:flagellar biosynthesis/type III secretory pathway M-ring protein FliF/YscJ